MLLLFTACRRDPPPATDSAATDPWAGCPTLDWVVQVGDYLPDEVHSVEALPGGDVVVAGRYGGAPNIGLGPGERLRPSENYRDGFVARLGPDGHARWWHTLGGLGMDELPTLTWTNERMWVAGKSEVLGGNPAVTLTVDGEPLVEPPPDEVAYLAWAVAFDLDGAVVAVRSVPVTGPASGIAATEDPDGNSYLTGFWYSGTLTHGPWSVSPAFSVQSSSDHAFLAAWDPRGTPRWLTTLGRDGTVSQPIGLAWADGRLQWAVEVRVDGGRATAVASDGTSTPVVLGEQRGTVLSVDADTGVVLPIRYRSDPILVRRFERRPDGVLQLTGEIARGDARWWDADGERHWVSGYGGVVGTVDPGGALTSLASPEVVGSIRGANGDDPVVYASSPPWTTMGAGTPQAIDLEPEDGGDVVFVEEGGALRCLAWFTSPEPTKAFDAVFDEAGGVVVVGTFDGPMQIRTPEAGGFSSSEPLIPQGSGDAFIARFAPPDE